MKSFMMYVLHSPITAYVPNNVVKIILTQSDADGKRVRWITQILEFDLTIKTTKLVKGQGLAKLLAKSNCKVLRINSVLEIQGKYLQEASQTSDKKNTQEPSQTSDNKNTEENYFLAEGENPQEPSLHPEEKNPQEPLPSDQIHPLYIDGKSDWYQDIVNFLIHFEFPSSFSKRECKTLKLKAVKYCIINANLYWKDPLNILLLCLIE